MFQLRTGQQAWGQLGDKNLLEKKKKESAWSKRTASGWSIKGAKTEKLRTGWKRSLYHKHLDIPSPQRKELSRTWPEGLCSLSLCVCVYAFKNWGHRRDLIVFTCTLPTSHTKPRLCKLILGCLIWGAKEANDTVFPLKYCVWLFYFSSSFFPRYNRIP